MKKFIKIAVTIAIIAVPVTIFLLVFDVSQISFDEASIELGLLLGVIAGVCPGFLGVLYKYSDKYNDDNFPTAFFKGVHVGIMLFFGLAVIYFLGFGLLMAHPDMANARTVNLPEWINMQTGVGFAIGLAVCFIANILICLVWGILDEVWHTID